MIRRSIHPLMPLCIGIVAVLVGGCGTAVVTPPASARPTVLASAAAPPSAVPSASAAPTITPTPAPSLPLPHVDAALEDKLPATIGGVQLAKFSQPLSTYVASLKGAGDSVLYAPWLVKFGKTPDDVNLAVAVDLTQTERFSLHAIRVPGVAAASLSAGFADVVRSKNWILNNTSIGYTNVLEIIDPLTEASGALGTAYVYARGDVLYIVVTDNSALLAEAIIKLAAAGTLPSPSK
jgi:hypothetical protein